MKVGSIVVLKETIKFDLQDMLMMAAARFTSIPVKGNNYVVEEMETFKCDNCNENHTIIGIDGVGNSSPVLPIEYFEEVLPPTAEEELNELFAPKSVIVN